MSIGHEVSRGYKNLTANEVLEILARQTIIIIIITFNINKFHIYRIIK